MIPAEKIVAKVSSLPPMPSGVTELARAITSDRTGAADVEKIVKRDPILSANVLRVANAAAYRGVERVGTVRDAVARIGMHRVYDIAIGLSYLRCIPRQLAGYEILADAFWLHSVAAAVFADRFARPRGIPGAELAFTTGLLHDIGKVVLSVFLAEQMPTLLSRLEFGRLESVAQERELVGTDHAEVGAVVAEKWRMPEAMAAAIRFHHDAANPAAGPASGLAHAAHVGDFLARHFGFGSAPSETAATMAPEIAAIYPPEDVELLAAAALGEIQTMTQAIAVSAAA